MSDIPPFCKHCRYLLGRRCACPRYGIDFHNCRGNYFLPKGIFLYLTEKIGSYLRRSKGAE